MKQVHKLFGTTILSAFLVFSARSQPAIDWNEMNLIGAFRMEPKLELCDAAEVTCNDPIYEGTISIHVTRSDSGRLIDFEFKLNDRLLPLDVVERYGSIDDFRLRDLKVRYPSRYTPEAVSELVVGGLGARIQLYGLSFVDEDCEYQIRHVEILYDLRRDESETIDSCDSQP